MRGALVLALALVAAPASAVCQRGTTFCFCSRPARFAVVVTEAVAGAKATVRVERAGNGTSEGELLELPRAADEAVGARWLLRDERRQAIDAADTVGCGELGDPSGLRLPAQTVLNALADAGTCDATLEDAGFGPVCQDNGPSCAVAPAGLGVLAVLAWVLRRRKR